MSDFTCVGCGKPVENGVCLIENGALSAELASCRDCFRVLRGMSAK